MDLRTKALWCVVVALAMIACGGEGARGQCPVFAPGVDSAIAAGTAAFVLGDFNGDGKVDLLTSGSAGYSIAFGNGLGEFGTPVLVSGAAAAATSMVTGDFNGDGKLDVATVRIGSSEVTVLLGTGTGTFATPVISVVGQGPVWIVAADVNGDGKVDLITANSGSSLSVLLGHGDGTFATAISVPVGVQQASVAVGDFNRDGKPDLVVGVAGGNVVKVLLGIGDGTFSAPTTWTTGNQPRGVAVGDFNGDGKLDVVSANVGGNNVSVLLGNGDGTFAAAINTAAVGDAALVTVVDVNGDGKADLLVERGSTSATTLMVLLGAGNGTFAAGGSFVSRGMIGFADFNSDGRADVITAGNATATVLLGSASPQVATITQQPTALGVLTGSTMVFMVTATTPVGTGTIGYQWRRNGVNLTNGSLAGGVSVSGATTHVLQLANVSLADDGTAFDCVVSNGCGSVRSDPAGLGVADRCPVDFDHSGAITVDDLFAYLNAWFAGCP